VLLPFDERLVASVWFKFLCLHVLCGRKSRRISSLQRSMLVRHRGPCVCVCVCSSCVCVWVVNGKLRRHGKYCILSSHSVTVLFACACVRLSIEACLKKTNEPYCLPKVKKSKTVQWRLRHGAETFPFSSYTSFVLIFFVNGSRGEKARKI
jgi:hypothetical protein